MLTSALGIAPNVTDIGKVELNWGGCGGGGRITVPLRRNLSTCLLISDLLLGPKSPLFSIHKF